jgi:hydrogenase maturation factor HypF (carbamoyltransferase family)
VLIRGVVQGVFFRETVRRIAVRHGVAGFVRNVVRDRVEIEVEGEPTSVTAFVNDVLAHPPPGARVDEVASESVAATGARTFTIEPTVR